MRARTIQHIAARAHTRARFHIHGGGVCTKLCIDYPFSYCRQRLLIHRVARMPCLRQAVQKEVRENPSQTTERHRASQWIRCTSSKTRVVFLEGCVPIVKHHKHTFARLPKPTGWTSFSFFFLYYFVRVFVLFRDRKVHARARAQPLTTADAVAVGTGKQGTARSRLFALHWLNTLDWLVAVRYSIGQKTSARSSIWYDLRTYFLLYSIFVLKQLTIPIRRCWL